jgi:hypothetical protein
MVGHRRLAFATLATSALCSPGCGPAHAPRARPPTTEPRASIDAGQEPPTQGTRGAAPPPAALLRVAETEAALSLVQLPDTSIALWAGSLRYEVARDGRLSRAAAPASERGKELLGFLETPSRPGEPPARSALTAPLEQQLGAGARCATIPAFDGRDYARCTQRDHDQIFRLGEPLPTPMLAAPRRKASSWSVASDGALYGSEGRVVIRCEPGGTCSEVRVDMRPDHPSDPRASYGYLFPSVVPSHGRSWHELRVSTPEDDARLPASARELLSIDTVLARSRDDVWAVGTCQTRRVVLHLGAGDTLVRLPSEADARVLARNREPAEPWTERCPTVFVRSLLAAGELLGRRAELASLVSRDVHEAAIVTGRLGTEHVQGILLVRTYADSSVGAVQESAKRIAAQLGASSASLGCSPPVLEEAWRLTPRAAW